MSVKAKLGTKEAVFEVALRNVGFIEGPNNTNPFAPFVGHANNQPWCASFVAAVFKRAEVALPSISAYTPTMAGGFKSQSRWHSAGQPGDVVFFHWPSMGRIAHVGIVLEARKDGSYLTVEGNTDVAGGRTGGRVMTVVRRANIAGFGRPVYLPSRIAGDDTPSPLLKTGAKGPKVRDVQRALSRGKLYRADEIDGDYGPKTVAAVKKLQSTVGLKATGECDWATWACLRTLAHLCP